MLAAAGGLRCSVHHVDGKRALVDDLHIGSPATVDLRADFYRALWVPGDRPPN